MTPGGDDRELVLAVVPERDAQQRLDAAIDSVLDALDFAAQTGAEVDPLQTIVSRLRVRGSDLDFASLPLPMQMILGGMFDQ